MTDEDIPLDITGHEERTRPSATQTSGPLDSTNQGSETSETDSERDGESDTSEDNKTGESNDGDETVEPVEVLVQLAKDGEIDPWDIDIVSVTDKFLERIDEADLRTSGRALFYASVLLRMKGDAMLAPEPAEPEPEPWEQMLAGEDPDPPTEDPFGALEHEMERRLERKRARGMPQTLDELVRDLREAERDSWWKESREYDTDATPTRQTQELDYHTADQFRMEDEPTAAEVTERTHGEDIETVLEDVSAILRKHYEKGRAEVLFREIENAGGSRVETFLGILFLSHRGEVRLRQDELFGDLWVQDPSGVRGSGEALA